VIKTSLLTIVAIAVCACTQTVPIHDIPAKPDYIVAGVQAGDTVEITTKDGQIRKFVVKDVGANAIEGPWDTIPFNEITKVVKWSWELPTHPCGVGVTVGCSIPEVVLILSADYEQQAEKFHPACVTHDFCYRHGYATYGISREECDDRFYEDMKMACADTSGLDRFDFEQSAICKLSANQTFKSVRRYGEPHYRTTTSSYCEFRDEP
jgi:hypothetical protein